MNCGKGSGLGCVEVHVEVVARINIIGTWRNLGKVYVGFYWKQASTWILRWGPKPMRPRYTWASCLKSPCKKCWLGPCVTNRKSARGVGREATPWQVLEGSVMRTETMGLQIPHVFFFFFPVLPFRFEPM